MQLPFFVETQRHPTCGDYGISRGKDVAVFVGPFRLRLKRDNVIAFQVSFYCITKLVWLKVSVLCERASRHLKLVLHLPSMPDVLNSNTPASLRFRLVKPELYAAVKPDVRVPLLAKRLGETLWRSKRDLYVLCRRADADFAEIAGSQKLCQRDTHSQACSLVCWLKAASRDGTFASTISQITSSFRPK